MRGMDRPCAQRTVRAPLHYYVHLSETGCVFPDVSRVRSRKPHVCGDRTSASGLGGLFDLIDQPRAGTAGKLLEICGQARASGDVPHHALDHQWWKEGITVCDAR